MTNPFFLKSNVEREDNLIGFTLRGPLPKANTTTKVLRTQTVWLRMDRDYAGVTRAHLRSLERKKLPLRVVGLEVVAGKEILANRIVDA